MPEDVLTSSACPWLKSCVASTLSGFQPRGGRGYFPIILVSLALLYANSLFAQYAAFNSVAVNSFQSNLTWATGISTYDINHDGWDDITAASSQHGVAIYLNTHGDFEYINALENIEGNLKTVYWADYDNDTDADLLIIRYTANPILLRNDGNWTFTDVTSNLPIPIYSPLMQSACWADYDNDGLLDVYINNYYLQNDITNWLFHNNGDGTFSEVAAIAGVDNGSKPTYQSNWIDYDRDGDQDLYVSNDRDAGNQLYINQGNGYFLPDTSAALNIYMDAMGVQWHDHDYDGDFDVYISNEIEASVLIENQQGLFINATDSLNVGCPNHISWGVQWTDPDNDGIDDLCVIHKDFNNITCHFQRNTDLTYTLNNSSILSQEPYSSYCLVTGDFNNDGREDLVQSTVSPQRILVWLANPSSNNSVTIGLEGSVSNHDGIGAIIEVHAANKQLIKQVTCGESYYGQSSQHELFGLGSANFIDSVVVNWPSGWTDVLRAIDVNQTLMITEGSTYIDTPDTIHIERCFNEPALLATGAQNGVIWEDGTTLITREVTAAGNYSCTIPGPFNQQHHIVFQVSDFSPAVAYAITPVHCAGASTGEISIEPLEEIQSVLWQTGSTTTTLSNASAGNYNAVIQFINGCNTSLNITLENPEPIEPWIWADTVCAGGYTDIMYSSIGGYGTHTWNWFNANPDALTAGLYNYSITDEAGCNYNGVITIEQFQEPQLFWSTPYVCEDQLTSIAITSSEPVYIDWQEYEEPYALSAGEYTFSYSSDEGCWFDTVLTVYQFPEIELTIEATDSSCSNGHPVFYASINGGTPPFLYSWNTGDTDAFAQNPGQPVISCILTDANGCSAQEELWVSSTLSAQGAPINVYPNPAGDWLFITAKAKQNWQLIDSAGKCFAIGTTHSNQEKINLTELPVGTYILNTEVGNFTIIKEE